MMKWLLFVWVLICIAPCAVHAEVLINEIAWMGTINSANDEWIELYNNGDTAVSLSGWRLIASDGSPSISLSGNISALGYFLLERTDDSSAPPTADHIYSGALGNTGENLALVDEIGAVVDEMSFASGWPAGDSTTKETMQRSVSGWITAQGTPKAENVTSNNTESEQDSNSFEDAVIEQEDGYLIDVRAPQHAISGVAASFYGYVEDEMSGRSEGRYYWNFGDGAVSETWLRTGSKKPVQHVYVAPGTYSVLFEYNTNSFEGGEPIISKRHTVTVNDPAVEISSVSHAGVTIKNSSSIDIDLSGWYVRQDSGLFQIPLHTVVLSSSSVVFSRKLTNLTGTETVLLRPDKSYVTSYVEKPIYVQSSSPDPVSATSVVANIASEQSTKKIDMPWVPIGFGIASTIVAGMIIWERRRATRRAAALQDQEKDRFEYIKILEE